LQHLQELPELDRKFTINDDLKRHAMALGNLHELGDFEKLKDYTVKHDLYSQAIELYRHQHARLAGIMQLFANFLNNGNKYKEAAIGAKVLLQVA
jgi:elongator complex protein 1